MWRILVNIYVTLFVSKKNRTSVKYRLMSLRNRFYVKHKAAYVGKNFGCSGNKIKVSKHTYIGDNVGINGLIIMGAGDVKIGKGCVIADETLMITSNHNYEGEFLPFDRTDINKGIAIGDYVWLGARVTLLPGTTLGEGCIIQAGSVVHGNIPPCAIAGGNPAVVFKYRDKEHYERLKKQMEL